MRIGTCLAVLLLAATVGAYAEPCSTGWVCVEPDDHRDGAVDFFIRNLESYPVTVTLKVKPKNLTTSGQRTVTKTVPARARILAASYRPARAGRPTHYSYVFDWTVGSLEAEHDDDYVYRLPYGDGLRPYILQGFGSRFSHTGRERYTIDFDMDKGTPVHAAREGVVAYVVEQHDIGCWRDNCSRYANFIVVLHSDGTTAEYYHLQKDGALVEHDQVVERGQLIGLSGNTGHTTKPHLHFGVYRAIDWGRTQSLPIRLETDDGIVSRVRRGRGHRVPRVESTGRTQAVD